MRTEVRIIFDCSEIPGGAQAILGPARCGPDVATVREIPVLRQVEVCITLGGTDERIPAVLELLQRHGRRWLDLRRDHYTEEELCGARLLIMESRNEYEVFGGPRLGTTYELEGACRVCGAGARQRSALLIDGEELPKLDGLRATSTYYSDLIVDERLAEELETIGASGLCFRSVYAVMPDKRQIKLRWRQLCATYTLPPMSLRSTGIERANGCASCGRSGFSTKMDDPTRLAYRAQDLDGAEDVNTTWEWFGAWRFEGDVSEALFPYPWFLVSPKVMRVFRDAGVDSFNWLPIRVEDAAG